MMIGVHEVVLVLGLALAGAHLHHKGESGEDEHDGVDDGGDLGCYSVLQTVRFHDNNS